MEFSFEHHRKIEIVLCHKLLLQAASYLTLWLRSQQQRATNLVSSCRPKRLNQHSLVEK
ncbi:hypothetical protein [Moorena sp. SIO3H5]|uniref:hypothetical protein n=1 Tax=Moorena sp. SIO3H5 TaxID=2607834 RepID=UPI0013BE4184|nr:hypothetical protein [Moorena sp. SIO3H5]NEO72204.1 hypothetical protein [Moorena sp. SIO3H5]